MAAEIKTGSDYYQYLDVVQKLCGKLLSIQRNQAQIIYENFNITICKKKLDKEIEMIDELLSKQEDNLSQ